jgi:hypothetical protein
VTLSGGSQLGKSGGPQRGNPAANTDSSPIAAFHAFLITAHPIIDIARDPPRTPLKKAMERREPGNRIVRVNRGALKQPGLTAARVVVDGTQHSQEYGQSMQETTVLIVDKDDLSNPRHVGFPPSTHGFETRERADHRRWVFTGQHLSDQRGEARALPLKRQWQWTAVRVGVLWVRVPVREDMRKVCRIGESGRVPTFRRLF